MAERARGALALRTAAEGDLAALVALLDAESLPTVDIVPAHASRFIVATDGRRLAGAIGLEPAADAGLLRSLVVAPGYRGRGLGRRLVEALVRRARDRGAGALWLLTLDAADYFARFGFERRSRDTAPAAIRATAEFDRLCPDGATLMSRPLRQSP